MEPYKTPEERRLEFARVRVQKIKRYYVHLFIYALGILVYLLKTYLGAPLNFFPLKFLTGFIMWCWTFFIVVQTLQILFAEKLFDNNWEQRKINEILEKENQSKNRWE
ncbi:2TM domain-containing protein [Flavobacterium terrae]|uniref:2TM domain-containing protein n=2 Tax=Flavobacterium terrae TaxID=415425 RepID=A0A1M6CRP6_9FLAO|nr:2TM domain-containing protein [Flavobacterium terrae]